MKKLLTVKEVAVLLGIHEQTVYKRKSRIPHIRIPGIRFKESDIQRWVEENHHKPSPLLESFPNPKFDIALDGYDKLRLKWRTELKNGVRWTYSIGSVIQKETKNKEKKFCIHYQLYGHRVRKSLKGIRTRAEAVKILNSEIADILRGKYNFKKENSDITFSEMSDFYIEKYAKVNKKSWQTTDLVYLCRLKPVFGNYRLSEVTPEMIGKYKSERLSTGIKKCSVNRELSCLKKIFNVAIDWSYATDPNPVKKVKFFSEKENVREKILAEGEEEEKLFLTAAPHLKELMKAALNTGMRKGEICKLKWVNVDLEGKEIKIIAFLSKSGKERRIPINLILSNLLYAVRTQNRKDDYVFSNPETGKPYVDIKNAFKGACKRAGIEGLRFHDLRHTFASRLIKKGVDLIIVRDLLGHASVVTTQRYTHSQAKEKLQAVESLIEWQKNDKYFNGGAETNLFSVN